MVGAADRGFSGIGDLEDAQLLGGDRSQSKDDGAGELYQKYGALGRRLNAASDSFAVALEYLASVKPALWKMEKLIRRLKAIGVLRSPLIEAALRSVDRADFVPEEIKDLAYLDEALPIGEGQTISQPYTVVFMLELLAPKEGDCLMDVGYGSGWQTALLASIAGEKGRVYAVERVKKICGFGEANVLKYPELSKWVKFFCADATPGLPEEAETGGGFDGIIAAAEVEEIPAAWRTQLKIGGHLVYPKNRAVWREVKKGAGKFSKEEYPGFVFVPYVGGGR